MGNAGLGAALQYLGSAAPGIGAAWDDIGKQKRAAALMAEEKRRQDEKDALDALVKNQALKGAQQEYDITDKANTRNQDALAVLGKTAGLIGQRDSLSMLKDRPANWKDSYDATTGPAPTGELPPAQMGPPAPSRSPLGAIQPQAPADSMSQLSFAPGVQEQHATDVDQVAALQAKKPYEIAQEGMGQYRDTEAGKSFLQPFDEQRAADTKESLSTEASTRDEMERERLQRMQDFSAMERLKYQQAQENYRASLVNSREKAKNAYSERTVMLKPGQIDNLAGFENARNQLEIIKNTFKPEFVGPVRGRTGGVMQAVGMLGKEEAVFRSSKQEFDNMLLKLRSGAAVTPSEFERMKKEIGNPNSTPEQFLAIINRAATSIENQRNIYGKSLKKAGYNLGDFENDIGEVKDYSAKDQAGGGLDDAKKKRLEELRAKRAAGTLGK